MSYIPKNKIQPNLYTSGKEYTLIPDDSSKIYVGNYYKLYTGEVFTGRFNGDIPNSVRLFPFYEPEGDVIVNKSAKNPALGIFPTDEDYKRGYFTRYFTKRINQLIFEEINKSTYQSFSQTSTLQQTHRNYLYQPISLKWRLTGDEKEVYKSNLELTKLVEKTNDVLGLGLFLKENYLKYYKPQIQK